MRLQHSPSGLFVALVPMRAGMDWRIRAGINGGLKGGKWTKIDEMGLRC